MLWTPVLVFLGWVLLFYALIQYTTWTLESFRRGITVMRFHESFPVPIPSALLGRLLDVEDMSFKFITAQQGLFRTRERIFRRIPGFPLLGEISLGDQGTASINVRIPLAAILIWLVVVMVIIVIQTQDASSANAVLIGILRGMVIVTVLSIFLFCWFLIEKEVVIHGLGSIKKYVSEKRELA